jgi:tetratricopeptide (TPR) repeat protein
MKRCYRMTAVVFAFAIAMGSSAATNKDPCKRTPSLIGRSSLSATGNELEDLSTILKNCASLPERDKADVQVKLANSQLARAQNVKDPKVAEELRGDAVSLMTEAMKIDTSSVPVVVTLGRAYAASGKQTEAVSTYERLFRTSASDGRWQFISEYAHLLPEDDARPLEFYLTAVKDKRVTPDIQSAYIAMAARLKPKDALVYLWELFHQHRAADLERLGCEILPLADPWPDEVQKRELITVLTVGLTVSPPLPQEFASSPAAIAYGKTPPESYFAQPLAEIARLYDPAPLHTGSFSWWTKVPPIPNPPKKDLYPDEAFRRLMMALGSRLEQQTGSSQADLTRARDLYSAAVTFRPDQPSPDAAAKLAQLYVTTEQPRDFMKIVNDYDAFIASFTREYDRDDWKILFDYHRSIGQLADILSGMKAVVHDDPALLRDLAQISENQYAEALKAGAQCEPQQYLSSSAVVRYAGAQQRLGKPNDAIETVLKAIEYYLGHQGAKEAGAVLDAFPAVSIPETFRDRYRALEAATHQALTTR